MRRYLELFVWTVNFVLLGFGLYHAACGDYLDAVFDLGVWLILLVAMVALRRILNAAWVFRCIVLSIGGLFFWNATQGGSNGSMLFWSLLMPVFTCFLLGRVEGTIWGVAGGLILALLLHQAVPGVTVHDYPEPVKLRFFSVYFILTLVAVVYENARHTVEDIHKAEQAQLKNKQRKLELTQRALKKAIRRLNRSRARLNRAQALANVGSWEYDMESGRIELSPETRRIYGIRRSRGAVSINYLKSLVPDGNRILAGFENLVHFDQPFDMEFQARRVSGDREVILHAKAELARDEAGHPVRIFGVVQDITERKKAEAEKGRLKFRLQQAQKMEAIGTLAGGVAHDLNNILAGVLSYPELLLLQMPSDHPLRKPIDTIKKSGEKAAAIVQDLLTLARRNVVVHEVVNLNAVIVDYLSSPEFERLQAYHPGVRMETDLDKSLMNIAGSPVHLAKTVMNLVSNAAEAMPDGGVVTIATSNCLECAEPQTGGNTRPSECVQLRVRDQGMGINPEDAKRIFEPFFTKKVMGRSGTGLGMAVVWGTVQDHKGHIDINSTPGTGTVFTLHFPVTRAMAVKRSIVPARYDFPRGDGETVLIVDDMAEQRMIASSMLAELGYETVEAESGEAAVEFVRKNSADLILLDMVMEPGISGLETYRRIITIRPDQPAVIVSGYSKSGQVERTIALGATVYVKKPYTMDQIASAVRAALQSSRLGITAA